MGMEIGWEFVLVLGLWLLALAALTVAGWWLAYKWGRVVAPHLAARFGVPPAVTLGAGAAMLGVVGAWLLGETEGDWFWPFVVVGPAAFLLLWTVVWPAGLRTECDP